MRFCSHRANAADCSPKHVVGSQAGDAHSVLPFPVQKLCWNWLIPVGREEAAIVLFKALLLLAEESRNFVQLLNLGTNGVVWKFCGSFKKEGCH